MWIEVTKFDQRARALADRHYPRQRVGARQFMPPGQTLVLLSDDARAVWGVARNRYGGVWRWRSELIRQATAETYLRWHAKYGLPRQVLTTEVDPDRVRHKRDPGRCFKRAGWTKLGVVQRAKRRQRQVIFAAPPPAL